MDYILPLYYINTIIFSLHRIEIGYTDSISMIENCELCVERIAISVSVFTHYSKRKDKPSFVNFVGC